MKSSIFFLALGICLLLLNSCDPFKPFYQDIEGDWEITEITVGERSGPNGEALPDTIFTTSLGELSFSYCDKEAHANANCNYSFILNDGRSFQLEYQIVDTQDLNLVLSGTADGLAERENLFGSFDMILNEESMILRSQAKTFPLMATAYQGAILIINLNRK